MGAELSGVALIGAPGLANAALACVPRALGLEDREESSKTFGCFDRAHWHYQLADFPSAWFQTGSLFLALAATTPGPFHAKEKVRAWARAGALYLVKTAHRDGSLAEVYPFERSYCATAFAALHAARTLALLGDPAPEGLARIARWLASARPTDAANQVAAAAAALAGVAALVRPQDAALATELAAAADRRLDDLLALQSSDGFFLEYGGPDPGYQTVTLSCLVHLARSRPERAAQVVERAGQGAQALRAVLREDATYEWRTTRRRTQFLYPSGLVRFAPDLAARFKTGLERGRVIAPSWLDDRYFLHLAADFLEAARLDAGEKP